MNLVRTFTAPICWFIMFQPVQAESIHLSDHGEWSVYYDEFDSGRIYCSIITSTDELYFSINASRHAGIQGTLSNLMKDAGYQQHSNIHAWVDNNTTHDLPTIGAESNLDLVQIPRGLLTEISLGKMLWLDMDADGIGDFKIPLEDIRSAFYSWEECFDRL